MIITQPKDLIGQFVAQGCGSHGNWGPFTALAKVDKKGIVVGVVYNMFTGDGKRVHDCCMHVAARPGALWATPDFMYHAFAYPFKEMGCRRITGLVSRKNKRGRKFFEKIGMQFEACLKEQRPNDDTIVYRMFNDQCQWLEYEQTRRARSA